MYECLNIIAKYELPVFLIVEANGIAQTTKIKDTISGSIEKKCKSFGIDVTSLGYSDAYKIYKQSLDLLKKVKRNKPQLLILKSTRLGPHSKGDDTRSREEIKKLKSHDTLNKLANKINKKKRKILENNAKKFIENLFTKCLKQKDHKIYEDFNLTSNKPTNNFDLKPNIFGDFKGKRFGELINHYFTKLAKENKKTIFLGEDIVDPYGGAFKITKNLKSKFPKQVIATPISEASIVGISGGLSIEGF